MGGGEKGARRGISQMDMKSLRGMRLQGFLTLFTRATPGTPASLDYKALPKMCCCRFQRYKIQEFYFGITY